MYMISRGQAQGPRRGERSRESGQALMIFALFLGVSCGFAGLVSDVGFALRDRTSLQSGVDAAALAGVSALPDRAKAISLVTDYAARNGLSAPGVQLTINTPY